MSSHTRQASLKLDFLIVGGGVAGLAAAYALASVGHRVRVFESSSGAIASTASGFRMTPNGSKILEQWGIWDEFEKRGCKTRSCEFLDLESGARLGYLGWPDKVLRELGGEAYTVAYSDLYDLLRGLVQKAGVEVKFNCQVDKALPPNEDEADSKPAVVLTNGEVHHADVVFGADGSQSTVQRAIGEVLAPRTTGKVVYTGAIPLKTMQSNELLREAMEIRMPHWMGNGYHALGYPICRDEFWTFIFWQIEDLNDDDTLGWGQKLPPTCLKYGSNIDPRLQAVIENLPSVERVKNDTVPQPDSWIDESERIVLIGEAAHHILPCSQPSATIALEDACFLGTLFSHLRHSSQISSFLYAFEEHRQKRAARLYELELDNQTIMQLPLGPDRTARDHTWREQKRAFVDKDVMAMGGDNDSVNETNSEAESELRRQWLQFFEVWGYNASDAAEDWWVEWGVLAERALEGPNRGDV